MAKTKPAAQAAEIPEGSPVENKKFVYPKYDLWKIDVENVVSDKDGEPKKVKFTAVKVMRAGIKIEHNAATSLNTQSHNNMRRYYESGSIQNGHEETVTIK